MRYFRQLGLAAAACTVAMIGHSMATDAKDVRSKAQIRTVVDGLHKQDVAWREVRWKTCLLDGLSESRRTGKPLMLWIFIDRPIDDERC